MERVKYLGPSPEINVGGFGTHIKNKIESYPDTIADDLVNGSRKQRFELVDTPETGKGEKAKSDTQRALSNMTVVQLKAELDNAGIKYPGNLTKAELLNLF